MHRPATTPILLDAPLEHAAPFADEAPHALSEPADAAPPACAHRSIRQWASSERPRERLLELGARALSDSELLALLLGSGGRGRSAIDEARALLERMGSLGALLCATPERLVSVPGIGPARAAALLAVVELAARMQHEQIGRSTVIDRPTAVRSYLQLRMRGLKREVFTVLFLDSQNRLIRCDEMFGGTLNQTAVYPREVARRALELNAAAVILAHNHPSGVMEPSTADRTLTRSLVNTLETVDVRVLDHLIIAGPDCYSFAEHGLLHG